MEDTDEDRDGKSEVEDDDDDEEEEDAWEIGGVCASAGACKASGGEENDKEEDEGVETRAGDLSSCDFDIGIAGILTEDDDFAVLDDGSGDTDSNSVDFGSTVLLGTLRWYSCECGNAGNNNESGDRGNCWSYWVETTPSPFSLAVFAASLA